MFCEPLFASLLIIVTWAPVYSPPSEYGRIQVGTARIIVRAPLASTIKNKSIHILSQEEAFDVLPRRHSGNYQSMYDVHRKRNNYWIEGGDISGIQIINNVMNTCCFLFLRKYSIFTAAIIL